MKRHESREQAFLLIFESIFIDGSVEEIIENAKDARDIKINDFIKKILIGVNENQESIDKIIEDNSISWKKNRISKVALAIMRLAVYEMLYEDNIPSSVSINEAVEIAKKYSSKEEASFINGILGAIARSLEKTDE